MYGRYIIRNCPKNEGGAAISGRILFFRLVRRFIKNIYVLRRGGEGARYRIDENFNDLAVVCRCESSLQGFLILVMELLVVPKSYLSMFTPFLRILNESYGCYPAAATWLVIARTDCQFCTFTYGVFLLISTSFFLRWGDDRIDAR